MDNKRQTKKDSHNKQIEAHLRAGLSITPLDALHKYGCLRLSARIHNLRHDFGLSITTKLHENGYAIYSLKKA